MNTNNTLREQPNPSPQTRLHCLQAYYLPNFRRCSSSFGQSFTHQNNCMKERLRFERCWHGHFIYHPQFCMFFVHQLHEVCTVKKSITKVLLETIVKKALKTECPSAYTYGRPVRLWETGDLVHCKTRGAEGSHFTKAKFLSTRTFLYSKLYLSLSVINSLQLDQPLTQPTGKALHRKLKGIGIFCSSGSHKERRERTDQVTVNVVEPHYDTVWKTK